MHFLADSTQHDGWQQAIAARTSWAVCMVAGHLAMMPTKRKFFRILIGRSGAA